MRRYSFNWTRTFGFERVGTILPAKGKTMVKKKAAKPRKPRAYRAKSEKFKEHDRVYIRSDVPDEKLLEWQWADSETCPTPEEIKVMRKTGFTVESAGTPFCYLRLGFLTANFPRKFLTKNPDGVTLENVMPDTRDLLELLGDFHA